MRLRWAPALVLCVGVILNFGVEQQRSMPLVRSMQEVVPLEIDGFVGQDLAVSRAEADVAGFSNYLFRVYEQEVSPTDPGMAGSDAPWLSVYIGYYESQTRGRTIHSPKNCLPGAGWEALSNEPLTLEVQGRAVTVNRYLLQNGSERALALYWYQGRGRIAYDEYRVKLDLLLDAGFKRRSDEALVRIVVPVTSAGPEMATGLAIRAAQILVPTLDLALPKG